MFELWYLCDISDISFVPVSSSSSSVSWPFLQRSGCSTTNTHLGPLFWVIASGCPHSSVCLLIWSTTCSMPRARSNRYSLSFPFLSFPWHWIWNVLSIWFAPYPLLPFSPHWHLSSSRITSVPPLSLCCQGLVFPANTWLEIRTGSKEHGGGTSQRLARKKALTTSKPCRSYTHAYT